MGPINVALVQLSRADQALREAQARLDAATRDVRLQQRRTDDLAQKLQTALSQNKDQKARAANLELDLKTRDSKIEKLRTQQQNAKNNKEYQAFLVEINTEKVDRTKVEDETMKAMEAAEASGTLIKELSAHVETERAKLEQMRSQITDKIQQLEAEIESLKPARDRAAAAIPAKARDAFERMAERYDGEAMAAIARPDRRREEYICSGCNMDLVADIYNKLHTRDDLVFCPSCRRILYIPEDLPPEAAVNKKKPQREKPALDIPPAAPRRGESAVDVLDSTMPDEDDAPPDDLSETPEPQA